jgi:sugar/nucleoside kinase (ribokinase family)
MTRIAISGYASLDYDIGLASAPQPNHTVVVTNRASAWPRPGGSPIYVGAAIQRAGGLDVSLITWLGADLAGSDYVRHLASLGLTTEGVARSLDATPICILAYAPGGACYCFYEAHASAEAEYNAAQLASIEAADWVCLTVQPAAAARAALERISKRQYLVWAVKGDPAAFPEKLRRDLAARADLVVHSLAERDFVAPYLATTPGRPDRLVVETLGAAGATLTTRGRTFRAPIEKSKRVKTNDPTGAGDTFLGGLIAALVAKRDPVAALRAGEASARAMLIARNEKRLRGS